MFGAIPVLAGLGGAALGAHMGGDKTTNETTKVSPTNHSTINFNPQTTNNVPVTINLALYSDAPTEGPSIKMSSSVSVEKAQTPPPKKRNIGVTQNKVHQTITAATEHLSALKLAAIAGCGTCCWIWYAAHRAQRAIHHKGSWCNWHEHTLEHELANAHPQELALTLIMEIQKKYAVSKNSLAITEPLKEFLVDLEREEFLLTRYVQLGTFAQKIFLGTVVGIPPHELEQARKSLDHLHAVKRLFVVWTMQETITS